MTRPLGPTLPLAQTLRAETPERWRRYRAACERDAIEPRRRATPREWSIVEFATVRESEPVAREDGRIEYRRRAVYPAKEMARLLS